MVEGVAITPTAVSVAASIEDDIATMIVGGRNPAGDYVRLILEPDGTARLSDATVDRIARRVIELMKLRER